MANRACNRLGAGWRKLLRGIKKVFRKPAVCPQPCYHESPLKKPEKQGFSPKEIPPQRKFDVSGLDYTLYAEAKVSKSSSFAGDIYQWGERGPNRYDQHEPCFTYRARGDPFVMAMYRMQCLTSSQVEVVLENCGLPMEKEQLGVKDDVLCMVEKIMSWRDQRGDFIRHDDDDDDADDDDGFIRGEFTDLPLYMESVSEAAMQLGLCKSDLQLECLLRNIPYQGSDSKPQLISKLMHFKDTVFSEPRTLELPRSHDQTPSFQSRGPSSFHEAMIEHPLFGAEDLRASMKP